MSLPRLILSSRHSPVAAWAVIAMLALAACSPSASAPSPSEAGAVFGDTTVIISGRSFSDDITISAGSSVTFVNDDELGHTVTNGVDGVADANALFDVSVAAGATIDPILFETPGVYQATCKFHPTMHMTITVE